MKINKLTITPITKNYSKIVSYNPNTELATRMIKEHLDMAYQYPTSVPRIIIRRQLPKFLRDSINLDT